MNRKSTGGWEIQEESYYDRFRIFSAKQSKRINPRTGKPFTFFLMEGFDWVNIIAITPRDTVVLVKQLRHGSETFTLETPGGTVEPGEDPKDTAIRELLEETGYKAKDADSLGTYFPNPAMQAMKMHYFVAHGVERVGEQNLDSGEDIEVLEVPLDEIPRMILSGEISSCLVAAAFGVHALRKSNGAAGPAGKGS